MNDYISYVVNDYISYVVNDYIYIYVYPQAFEAVDRSHILDDAFNLARSTQLDYPTALDLTTYLRSETHYFPWKTVRNNLDYIGKMLYGRKEYNLWRVSAN